MSSAGFMETGATFGPLLRRAAEKTSLAMRSPLIRFDPRSRCRAID
jgi:hypothetical protein